jgi:dephospho-CoA kinase
MKVIGIVGGVASGKSLVTEWLAKLGVSVLNADLVGHEVLREPAVIAALVARWGNGILSADGQINRLAVARIVFAAGGDAEKGFLESHSHPRIAARLKRQLDDWRSDPQVKTVVLDAALMLETGWSELCDEIWFVDAPSELRRQRAFSRGWSQEQWQAREAAQWPVQRKRQAAQKVINNAGSPEETCKQAEQLLRSGKRAV